MCHDLPVANYGPDIIPFFLGVILGVTVVLA